MRSQNYKLVCRWCESEFSSHRPDAKWCSKACGERPQGRLPTLQIVRPGGYDLAWAAGFFDGEGTFTARKIGGRRYLTLSVVQKQPTELIEKFAGLFKVGKTYSWSRGDRDFTTYMAHGREAFYIADLLWPWLGERKRADFKRVLHVMQDGKPRQTHRGRRFVYVA